MDSNRLKKLESALRGWNSRNLTYYGRLSVVKTFGISQLLYCANATHVPDYVIKEANKMLYQFIWSSKKEKVKIRAKIVFSNFCNFNVIASVYWAFGWFVNTWE